MIRLDKTNNGGIAVTVQHLKTENNFESKYSIAYDSSITKELRLYLQSGNDSIILNNGNSPITIRIIGGSGAKVYRDVGQSAHIKIYDTPFARFSPNYKGFTKISADTVNTRFRPTNLYNRWVPLATGGINADDGFLLGLGFKYEKNDGFRKSRYTSSQQLMLTHSFATNAFRIKYSGDWVEAVGKADITLQASVDAPDNTTNYFGYGNGTILNKTGDYHRFYRARFDLYRAEPGLRWRIGNGAEISTAASLQFYHLNRYDNEGRIVEAAAAIGSYDSLSIAKDKVHLGGVFRLTIDNRSNKLLPDGGIYLDVHLNAYKGINAYSKGYLQFRPELTLYKKLDHDARIVISDRIGGGLSVGQPAFYQSMFLGGQGNLLGYLQNRFAGRHMIYNNLQARVKLFNIASYILPGQFGLIGFHDAGRVWPGSGNDHKWHQGSGGGLYFMPAGLTVFQVLAGHSNEGWYPYVSFSFRI